MSYLAFTLAGKHLFSDILDFNRWSSEKAVWLKTKSGKDLVHHYDSRMDEVTRRIKNRLGPTERFLFKGNVKEALFTGVPKALHPNPVTISAAQRVKNVVGSTKVAGAALLVVDAVLTCNKLAATEQNRTRKSKQLMKRLVGWRVHCWLERVSALQSLQWLPQWVGLGRSSSAPVRHTQGNLLGKL